MPAPARASRRHLAGAACLYFARVGVFQDPGCFEASLGGREVLQNFAFIPCNQSHALESCQHSAAPLCHEAGSQGHPALGSHVVSCLSARMEAQKELALNFAPGPEEARQTPSKTIVAYLEAFVRSSLLYYFLACAHLVLYVCKQRPSQPTVNRSIRYGRSCLRGAPLWLAFGIAAHLLPVVHCAGRNETRPLRVSLFSLLVPVMMEVHSLQPCRGRVDFEVIRLAVGHRWIPGGRVYVGSSETPLGLGQIAQLQPGTLPKGKPVFQMCLS